MKAAILLCFMVLASTYAFTPFLFEEGHKFLDFLKDRDHRCFVMFFYNSNAAGRKVDQQVLDDRNRFQRKNLEARIDEQPNISYATVDIGASDLDADTRADILEFLEESRIDVKDLDSYPITTVMDDGVGAYVWGPKQELVVNQLIDAFRHGRLGNPHN